MSAQTRTAAIAVVASLATVLSLAALACVPIVNHYAKRLLTIPAEPSGPHAAGPLGDDTPIVGSKDFIYCALSRAPNGSQGSCNVTKRSDGWHVTGTGPDPQSCAAMCLK